MAKLQISPGNAHPPSRLCPPHLRPSFTYRYRTLKSFAFSSSLHASYAISVRRTSALPAASFRFHLAMDTLAVQLTIPPVGFVGDFHSQVTAPCRAHKLKRAGVGAGPLLIPTWNPSLRALVASGLRIKLRCFLSSQVLFICSRTRCRAFSAREPHIA